MTSKLHNHGSEYGFVETPAYGEGCHLVSPVVTQTTKQFYQAARNNIEEFKPKCFDLLYNLVSYDFISWMVVRSDTEVVTQLFCMYNNSKKVITDSSLFNTPQKIVSEAISNPGVAIVQQVDFNRSSISYSSNYQINYILTVADQNPVNGLFTVITLSRVNIVNRFMPYERLIMESLIGHLIEAGNHNLCHYLYDKNQLISAAIADFHGTLHYATDEFKHLMQKEWPSYKKEQKLSQEIINSLHGSTVGCYCGERIIIGIQVLNNLLHLEAKLDQRNPSLTQRQREICQLVIEGKPEKAIADSLGVKVKTISNHLNHIYGKLDVHSKTQLIRKFTDSRKDYVN